MGTLIESFQQSQRIICAFIDDLYIEINEKKKTVPSSDLALLIESVKIKKIYFGMILYNLYFLKSPDLYKIFWTRAK